MKINKTLEDLTFESGPIKSYNREGMIYYYDFYDIITTLSDILKTEFIEIPQGIIDELVCAYNRGGFLITPEGVRQIILLNIAYKYLQGKDKNDLSFQYKTCVENLICDNLDPIFDDSVVDYDLDLTDSEKDKMYKIHNFLIRYYMSYEDYSEKQVRNILEGKKTGDEL